MHPIIIQTFALLASHLACRVILYENSKIDQMVC